jgi:hypothetical protein
MFFRVFTQQNMDAVRAAMERRQTEAATETIGGMVLMIDVDGAIVIEKADLVKVVGSDRTIDPASVEKTLLESEQFGWVPLSFHVDFSNFRNTSLEPDPEGFTLPFQFHAGYVEDVDFKMK